MDALKAALYLGPGKVELREVPEPKVRAGEVLIRVRRVGICGTDKAFYKGTYKPLKVPLIPGHEVSGEVVEVGEGVSRDLVGKRVTTEINVPCGKCWFCRRGLYTHCINREVIGISRDGGMAEYLVVPSSIVHVTEGLSYSEAALIEPLAAVIQMIRLEPPEPGSDVAIIGTGTIALLTLQVMKAQPVNSVTVISRPDSPKARVAEELGADTVISVGEVRNRLSKVTRSGVGFDYVVEASGNPEGIELALSVVRPRGVVALKSTHGVEVKFDLTRAVVNEVRLVGSRCGPFEPAIKLVKRGVVDVGRLVTSTYSLEQVGKAFTKSFERGEIKVQIEVR